MGKILLLFLLIISLNSNAQTREKLQGIWVVRTTDSTSKQIKEIEFQFKKKDDWIVMRSKGRLNVGTSKSNVNIFERSSSFSFMTKLNGQYYTINYQYNFLSDDVLVLTNANDTADTMTLDRKK
jgi:hypothetical protein